METIKFEELQLDDRILRAVADMGFEETSPIQGQAIPLALGGQTSLDRPRPELEKRQHSAFRCWRELTQELKNCRQLCSVLPENWQSR